MTRSYFKPAGLALSLAGFGAGAALASSYESLKPEQAQQVRDMLKAQSYEVRKIDSEDGMIEVYALKDGKKFELYLNEKLEIVKQKIDD